MTCRDARRRFGRWLDGRLEAADRDALAAHLAACAPCRGELARWEAAAAVLRRGGPTAPPPDLAERAFRAATTAPRAAPLAAWFVPAARRAVVAAALAAALAWLGALATGTAPGRAPAGAIAAEDPMELALQQQLFAAEDLDDGR